MFSFDIIRRRSSCRMTDAVGVLRLGQRRCGSWIHHSIRTAHAAHIDSCYKSYRRRGFWVRRPTFYFKAVLYIRFSSIVRGGPIIMPVHLVSVMSLSSSRPQPTVSSPTPLWPSSSSSNSQKSRGTFTPEPVVAAILRLCRSVHIFFQVLEHMHNCYFEVLVLCFSYMAE